MGSLALTERGGRRQGCIDKGMKDGVCKKWFEGRAKNEIEGGGEYYLNRVFLFMFRKSLFII